MDAQVLAYPFLFVSIFLEAFILVTFLSAPARKVRARGLGDATPSVAIIVPCYNESATLAATVDSLLALDYPKEKLEVILVDDGSTDATSAVMQRFASNPQIKIINKANGGKYTALNAGIAATRAEIVGCLDADSFVERSALGRSLACFDSPEVAAVAAAMSVHEPSNLLEHMQNAEYIFGITRQHSMSIVGGIHVTPGPFSLYRRAAIVALGGFQPGHQTEDLEMALRLQRAGYRINHAPAARVYTKAPTSILALIRQRTRWTSGFMRNVLKEYRGMIGKSRYGALGLITLPLGLVMIGGSILLFGVALFELGSHALVAVETRAGIPLSYALALHGLNWFYLPANLYVLLGAFALATALAMIVMGQRISQTPGNLALGVLSYTLLYGLVAPLWLMRACYDVVLGKERNWR